MYQPMVSTTTTQQPTLEVDLYPGTGETLCAPVTLNNSDSTSQSPTTSGTTTYTLTISPGEFTPQGQSPKVPTMRQDHDPGSPTCTHKQNTTNPNQQQTGVHTVVRERYCRSRLGLCSSSAISCAIESFAASRRRCLIADRPPTGAAAPVP